MVLCIVDIFDLRGSILTNLRNIVGTNPIVIAANKIDLLPVDVSLLRVQSWIHNEIKQICGYRSPRDEEDSNEYFAGNGNAERQEQDSMEEEMYFGEFFFVPFFTLFYGCCATVLFFLSQYINRKRTMISFFFLRISSILIIFSYHRSWAL